MIDPIFLNAPEGGGYKIVTVSSLEHNLFIKKYKHYWGRGANLSSLTSLTFSYNSVKKLKVKD